MRCAYSCDAPGVAAPRLQFSSHPAGAVCSACIWRAPVLECAHALPLARQGRLQLAAALRVLPPGLGVLRLQVGMRGLQPRQLPPTAGMSNAAAHLCFDALREVGLRGTVFGPCPLDARAHAHELSSHAQLHV
jgi:hypothetical protein